MCVPGTLDLIKDSRITGVWVPVGAPERLPSCPFDDETGRPHKLLPEVDHAIGEAPRMNGPVSVNPNVLLITVGEYRLDNDAVVGSVNACGHRSANDT